MKTEQCVHCGDAAGKDRDTEIRVLRAAIDRTACATTVLFLRFPIEVAMSLVGNFLNELDNTESHPASCGKLSMRTEECVHCGDAEIRVMRGALKRALFVFAAQLFGDGLHRENCRIAAKSLGDNFVKNAEMTEQDADIIRRLFDE